jgi:hypothetical protein
MVELVASALQSRPARNHAHNEIPFPDTGLSRPRTNNKANRATQNGIPHEQLLSPHGWTRAPQQLWQL